MIFLDTDNRVILCLGLIILNLYLLVYMNAPSSIDGADTLDVAITWVQHGEPTATRLISSRQLIVGNGEEEFYTLSNNGERYSKKGIIPSLILLPLLMLTEGIPALSPRAVAMLLNPIVTMLTACQLYLFARSLNASWKVSTGLAILFAFGTISVVYVKTLFGEPLAGLLLVVALYQSYNFTQDAKSRRVILSGIAIALAIGVNFSYVLLTIPIGLYILSAKRNLKLALLYGLPILLMGVFLGYWNILRFGGIFETGYGIGNDVEGFTTPLFYGLTGLWLSFYKGVFWFQPILLLGLFGLKRLWDKQQSLLIVSLSIILIHSTTYAMWWAWDGAWSWGSRFMLPILPIMCLYLLPVLKQSQSNRFLRVIVGMIALGSCILQLSGILYSYIPFYETVYNGELFRWQNHIALATFANLYSRILDPAWLSEGVDGIHLLIVCLSIGSGIASVYLFNKKLRQLLVLSILSLTCIFIAIRQQAKPPYDFVREWEHTLGNNGTTYIQSFEFDTRLLDIDGTRIIVTNPHAPQNNPLI